MTPSRLIVQGEPHGCFEEVLRGLDAAQYNPHTDQLWCLGDAVDRGPDGLAVLDIYMKFGAGMVLGNHEMRLLRYIDWVDRSARTGESVPMKIDDDLTRTYDQLRERVDVIRWLQSCPIAKTFGNDLAIVHGGFLPNQGIARFLDYVPFWGDRRHALDHRERRSHEDSAKLATMLRFVRRNENLRRWVMVALESVGIGDSFWADEWHEADPHVIYGHQPWRQVKRHLNATGIDTGCVFGGSLTTVVIPWEETDRESWRFISTPAARVYYEPPAGSPCVFGD